MKTRVSRFRLRGTSNFWVGTARARSRLSTFRVLTLARNPGLLVLNDFSMGLDPGYQRLFVECLRDYARGEEKPIFLSPPRYAAAVERVVGRLHIRRGCQN